MMSLSNLIPNPRNKTSWVPRPASGSLTTFAGLTSPAQGNALLVIGNLAYGMIAETSGAFSGLDVPFAYNIKTAAFETISFPGGAGSLPTTPSPTGDWTPPTMAQIGPRILITHPGFAGGASPFFGWLDISGFSDATVTGNTNSTKTINVLSKDVLVQGWQPGMKISSSASDIPANTTIVSLTAGSLDLNTTATLNGTNTLTSVASVTGVVVGATCSQGGVALGLVTSIPGGGVVVLNNATPASLSNSGVGINFSGATTITLSNAATGSNSGVTLTVTGGTPTAPLYSSGNTNVNPLPSVPVAVFNFNGRAYFACPGNGMKFSDSLVPCNITNASQGLNPANGLDITAFGGLGEQQTLGGILQALICFQGDAQMQQVTGDPATSNLALNELGVGVGTLAPNAIAQTPLGLSFVAPDGLRIIGLTGNVSEPIGSNGDGVCVPFLNVVSPTRMCAAYNQNVIRISVQNGAAVGEPVQEYWYDFTLKVWSGPHTFPAALIQSFQGTPNHGFVLFASGINAELWSSSVTPTTSDTYTENGVALAYNFQTVLLPDDEDMSMQKMVLTTLTASLGDQQTVTVQVLDEGANVLDTVTISGPNVAPTIWGSFSWGAANWGGPGSFLYQHPLNWHQALIFKQATLMVTGNSALNTIISNVNMQLEPLGYMTSMTG